MTFALEVLTALYSSPLTFIGEVNYALGIGVDLGIVVGFLLALNDKVKYASFLIFLPVINVFVVTFLIHKLTSSRALTTVTFVTWMGNLIVVLLFKIPTNYLYALPYYLPYLVATDVTSLISLLVTAFCLYKQGRRKKEVKSPNLVNKEGFLYVNVKEK
jgi:hypothetical protein